MLSHVWNYSFILGKNIRFSADQNPKTARLKLQNQLQQITYQASVGGTPRHDSSVEHRISIYLIEKLTVDRLMLHVQPNCC